MLAEWLDNDADGCVDNPEVLEQLTNAKDVGDQYGMGREWMVKPAFIFPSTGIFDTDWDTIYRATILEGFYEAQKVYKSGWFPDCIGAAATGDPYCRDESLEEIWHGITDIGYAGAWPDVFGRDSSLLTQVSKETNMKYEIKYFLNRLWTRQEVVILRKFQLNIQPVLGTLIPPLIVTIVAR